MGDGERGLVGQAGARLCRDSEAVLRSLEGILRGMKCLDGGWVK